MERLHAENMLVLVVEWWSYNQVEMQFELAVNSLSSQYTMRIRLLGHDEISLDPHLRH